MDGGSQIPVRKVALDLDSRSTGVTADGTFLLSGTNRTGILLLHGLTGSPVEMRPLGLGLWRAGFTVSAPLLAGHGADATALCATRWQDWRDSAAQALAELMQQVDSVFVAGICVGGLLGLHLAQSERRICGVGLYSPGFNYDGWNMPYYTRWSRLGLPLLSRLPAIRTLGLRERQPFGIKNTRLRRLILNGYGTMPGALDTFPFAALHEGNRFFRKVLHELPHTTVPLLVVQAIEDDICSPRHAHRIARTVIGPCHVHFLHDSYHLVHLDQERATVTRLTTQFMTDYRRILQ